MTLSIALECKKLCVRRCFYAVLYSLAGQIILLLSYLLFVQFNPVRPLDWLTGTIAAILSWRTWLCLIPLLAAVIGHGILLGKAQLAERRYHAHRFALLAHTVAPMAALLAAHMLIGGLTGWLYVRYLPDAFSGPTTACGDDVRCLNDRYAMLLLAALFAAIYDFVGQRVRKPLIFVRFPLVQQARYLEMRTNVHTILGQSVRAALLPTVMWALVGNWLGAGGLMVTQMALVCGLERPSVDGVTSTTVWLGVQQLVFTFVIVAQIICNMRLTEHLLGMLLTERVEFPVERPAPCPMSVASGGGGGNGDAHSTGDIVRLVDALAVADVRIVRELAALDLSRLGDTTDGAKLRRRQVYALSVPGGHPYNWTALSGQCLQLVDAFRTELRSNVERAMRSESANGLVAAGVGLFPKGPAAFGVRGVGGGVASGGSRSGAGETAGEMAARLLMRQYNETYGIRNMTSPTAAGVEPRADNDALVADPCRRFNEQIERVTAKWQHMKAAVMRLPGEWNGFFVVRK